MAGHYDYDLDVVPGLPIRDALGRELRVGDSVAHIAKIASRTRVTKREILAINLNKGTMTISPTEEGSRFMTNKPGKNVKGVNVLKVCECNES